MDPKLLILNFQDLLQYDINELAHRGSQNCYNPPLQCKGYCTACDADNSSSTGKPALLSHGCSTSNYESLLGDLHHHLQAVGIQERGLSVVFLLESPGGYWKSGDSFPFNGFEKQPPTIYFYWLPHQLSAWPALPWKRQGTDGEFYGDYFSYLMVRHGLVNVYITDIIKCSWDNSYTEQTKQNCVSKYLTKEIKIAKPQLLVCFSIKVNSIARKLFPHLNRVCLYHPSYIENRWQTLGRSQDQLIAENDTWISQALYRRSTTYPIGIGTLIAERPSHTTQHTGPYCAVRLIEAGNQVQGNERPSDLK